MILYVNGDSHSAGAEAVNSCAFAEDDPLYHNLGRRPHPDNLKASYGCYLANTIGAIFDCDAESASSNSRILRSTRKYLENNRPDLIIIGWSTWEREEWWDESTNRYWQVNAGGIGHDWPEDIKQRYHQWILNVDYDLKETQAHADIYQFHLELLDQKIPHFFFNCYSDFNRQPVVDWSNSYLEPYNPKMTYWQWLTDQGYKSNSWFHFNADAHRAWAEFLTNWLTNIL